MEGRIQMTKRRLRTHIRYMLIGIIIVSIITSLIILDTIVVNNAIDKCTNAGHSVSYCKSGL